MSSKDFSRLCNKMSYFALKFHSPDHWKDGKYQTQESKLAPANQVITFSHKNDKDKSQICDHVYEILDDELNVHKFFGI